MRDFLKYWNSKSDSDHTTSDFFDTAQIAASEIKTFFDPTIRRKVLDLGCGAGELFGHLGIADLVPAVRYVGVDFSKSMLDAFRSRFPDLELVHAPVDQFQSTEQYDFIVINNVIQYLHPEVLQKTLANIKKMLAPGGLVFLGNIPHRRLHFAFNLGKLHGSSASSLPAKIKRWAYAVRYRIGGCDSIGYWYDPLQILNYCRKLGLLPNVFGCTLYMYRFTVVAIKPKNDQALY